MKVAALAVALGLSVQAAMAQDYGSWTPDCKTDPMDDSLQCKIVNERAAIAVFFQGKNHKAYIVCVYAHDFPGRSAQIRVDKNPAVVTGESGCISASEILAQMKAGNRVRSRAYEWPYDVGKDREGSLKGLSAAIAGLLSGKHD